jgi:N-methylhydantoinase B
VGEQLKRGQIPVEFDALDGALEAKLSEDTFLKRGDVFERVACGGGGFGDPLERDPELVRKDVQQELVSARCAEEIYGVVFGPGSSDVDYAHTEQRRARIRAERSR